MTATSIKRTYTDFRGVDFLNEASLLLANRSPDALNVWKNYENTQGTCIETRPGYRKIAQIGNDKINGIYIYQKTKAIVHSETKLYLWNNFPSEPSEDNIIVLHENMNRNHRTCFHQFDEKLYINDGSNYLVYDGTELKDVSEISFIPTTTIGRKPSGGGERYQDVNLLTPKRINSFLADGTSTEYYLDSEEVDNIPLDVIVNDIKLEENVDYTVDRVRGKVVFSTAPSEPSLSGKDNVFITYSHITDYTDRISKCTRTVIFDNRMFYTGNPNFPNAIFHSELKDPTYVSDLSYYEDGTSESEIKDIVVGNNILWAFKNSGQENANVFYHTPTIDEEQGAVYPCSQGNVSTACYVGATNFKDDIVYLSREGLEGIVTVNLESRQIVAHRSTLVDPKMKNDSEYHNAQMVEWKGYLLILVGEKIFLADTRQKFNNLTSFEYEWYYWNLGKSKPTILKEYKDELYIGAEDGAIYILGGTNDNGEVINSYWTTIMDNFGYDNLLKTTSKRGALAKIKTIPNGIIKIARRTNKSDEYKYITQKIASGFDFNKINFEEFSFNTKDQFYLVFKLKEKKINEISLKFYSDELDKPFGIYSASLVVFLGGYIKK